VEEEKALLVSAAETMGRIPVDRVDLLIIDQFGKDISGIGMDSNVTGRHRDIVGDFYTHPHVKRIFVRDFSPGSDGNANGIGLADVTTTRLVSAMDRKKTYANSMAAVSIEKAAIPMYFDTDREALAACAAGLGLSGLTTVRMVRIISTKHLEVIEMSMAFEKEIEADPGLSRISAWSAEAFDDDGNLLPFGEAHV